MAASMIFYTNNVILSTVTLIVATVIVQVKADCCYNVYDDTGLDWWQWFLIALCAFLFMILWVWACYRRCQAIDSYHQSREDARRRIVIIQSCDSSDYGTIGNPEQYDPSNSSGIVETPGHIYTQPYGHNQQHLHVQSQLPAYTTQVPTYDR
ncbi:uncharacterized protein LOC144353776 isoform X2 [Saccoglossus kowalevskii]